ncbi:D-hexose-6-phosphate mutarotase [filamentous cyanobacterium LEGE 11480]|uniref:Putative glucose-6-phosphate 1-epimerase n=1 Tax=Romeriopsis navalis LEGE 11480 TaxID=2777977 RepID=A0A928VVR9_9CYAN|nr:D-hexose-6-phosphate mutarotase [Romeriopsis navalis]MBE9033382.1 D-hexose-6-phosphate mutarotase [Romeriopsis navalis LEGE 11480]
MTIAQLNTDHAIDGQLKFVEGKGGFPIIEVDNGKAKATISVYGGQVLSFQPTGEAADVMFLSDKAYYAEGKAIKGGIPICWPWFGPDPEGKGRASHGLMRNRMWQVISTAAVADGTQVILGLSDSAETQAIWPQSFKFSIEITVSDTLKVELVTVNTGDQAFPITQALHTYFTIGDIAQTKVIGLGGTEYLDKVDGGKQKAQTGDISISSEVDRVYLNVAPQLTIDDGALGRKINIASTGSKTAIVWNPWSEIAANMADLDDADYKRFVCVETANAANEVIDVAAGSEYRMGAVISVTR